MVHKLKARNGYKLTEAKEVSVMERTFATTIYLATNDVPENYKEIEQSEVDKILAIQEQENQKRRAKMIEQEL